MHIRRNYNFVVKSNCLTHPRCKKRPTHSCDRFK